MDFSNALGDYKKEIDKELAKYFQRAILDLEKKDPLIAEALKQISLIALSGGKRIRGALLCVSYFGFSGKEKQKVIKVAAAIELVHLFLLIHDDVIDRGDFRHGQSTLHKYFAKKQNKINSAEADHFGNSIAIVAGELLYAQALKMIFDSGFESDKINFLVREIQEILTNTIVGQTQDIAIAYKKNVKEEEVLQMYQYKTAKYTFEGPLQLGAILAGHNDKKTLKLLSDFSIPLGVAYQIQDDMLSVFGDIKNIGKSCASDIEEGKKTLMVVKAIEFLSDNKKNQLQKLLGKKNISSKDIAKFQNLIIESGSHEYCLEMIEKNFAKGKKEVEKLMMLAEQKSFLKGMIEYLENRDK